MTKQREFERRVHDSGPPNGCVDRRCTGDYRKVGIFSTSFDEFESIVISLGFRYKNPVDFRHLPN
jgi:hypothetical protein